MITSRLKIVITLRNTEEARKLMDELVILGHRVELCYEAADALRYLREWQPDLIITEEGIGRNQPEAGLRLAEFCRATEDMVNGGPVTRTLILIPNADWDRFKRAQQTGAHVIVRGTDFNAVVRYMQTVVDDLITDRALGPMFIGVHQYTGSRPHLNCENCQWGGAEIAYGNSKSDVRHLTPVRIVLLNALLFRRRGQSPLEIEIACRDSPFLRTLLGKHVFRQSAIKMEVTRLRKHFDEALCELGIPYTGRYFLPVPAHGARKYCLAGNRRLVHVPALIVADISKDSPCALSM